MIKKILVIFPVIAISLATILTIYTQTPEKLQTPVGNWVIYKIDINQYDDPSSNTSYLFKISFPEEEIIEGKSHLWEEISLMFPETKEENITIKKLKRHINSQPKKIIFQKPGTPALEIDPDYISKTLNIDIRKLMPEIFAELPLINTITDTDKSITGKTDLKYKVPVTKKPITCTEIIYNDFKKSTNTIAWTSDDIPITKLAKATFVSKKYIISVKLIDFGLTGATTMIKGKILKFGEMIENTDGQK